MKLVFKILCFLCLLISNCAFAKEVKFIHITDIGLDTKNAYQLLETIEEINSYHDIDFVIFGGCNIKKPNIDNLNTFLYLLKKVNKKSYVLIGSSDVLSTTGINKAYYMKRVRKALLGRHKNSPNYVFQKNGYVFIAMDGSKQYFQSANGYYNKDELIFLEKNLKKYKKKNVIILQHFPLLETSSKWVETAKKEEYFELLKKYDNVKVIVSGHYDSNDEIKKDGIYHILTEKYSSNGAYKIIQIDLDEDFIGTYLVK